MPLDHAEETCAGCRFQIDDQCRWGPPAVLLLVRPAQSPSGIVLGANGNHQQAQVSVQPVPHSLYPPAPDHMKACFRREELVGDHCEEETG